MKTLEQVKNKLRTINISTNDYVHYLYYLKGKFSEKEAEDLNIKTLYSLDEYKRLSIDDFIKWFEHSLPSSITEFKNLKIPFPEELNEKLDILNYLVLIRDYYNEGWIADFSNNKIDKYIIYTRNYRVYTGFYTQFNTIFAFKTKELRNTFLNNFRQELQTLAYSNLI